MNDFDASKKTLQYAIYSGLFIISIFIVRWIFSPPPETLSENVLAIGSKAVEKGEFKVPLIRPIDLSGLTRSELFRTREVFVNQQQNLLAAAYKPTGEVFAHVRSKLPWFSLYGFFCKRPGSGKC